MDWNKASDEERAERLESILKDSKNYYFICKATKTLKEMTLLDATLDNFVREGDLQWLLVNPKQVEQLKLFYKEEE